MTRKPQFDIVLQKDTYYKGLDNSIGVTIQGYLRFMPTSKIKIKKLYLEFEGKHAVETAKDFRQKEETFFQHRWDFVDSEYGELLEGGKEKKLNFTLSLPGDLPESVEADCGSIQYKFKAYTDIYNRYFNLKKETPIFLRRHTSALLDEHYITEVANVWREAVSYYLCIPSVEVAPGDQFALKVHHRVLKDMIRVLLVACILKEHIVYYSPSDPNIVVREHETSLDTAFAWCQEDHMGEGKRSIDIRIPSTIKSLDSRNKRIEVTHRLHVRIDIDWHGRLENIHIDLPVAIVSQIEGTVEELPDYNALPCPPTYEELLPRHHLIAL